MWVRFLFTAITSNAGQVNCGVNDMPEFSLMDCSVNEIVGILSCFLLKYLESAGSKLGGLLDTATIILVTRTN
ncbi:MAG: hypothetical protein ISS81_09695 [Candidatus Marinimicrobia bacterium]|nr:hypothetical protein [Candidatus Neomarinimicrobiota bacterium]